MSLAKKIESLTTWWFYPLQAKCNLTLMSEKGNIINAHLFDLAFPYTRLPSTCWVINMQHYTCYHSLFEQKNKHSCTNDCGILPLLRWWWQYSTIVCHMSYMSYIYTHISYHIIYQIYDKGKRKGIHEIM